MCPPPPPLPSSPSPVPTRHPSHVYDASSHAVAVRFATQLPPPHVEQGYLDVFKQERWAVGTVNSAADTHSTITGGSGVKMAGPYGWVPPNYWCAPARRSLARHCMYGVAAAPVNCWHGNALLVLSRTSAQNRVFTHPHLSLSLSLALSLSRSLALLLSCSLSCFRSLFLSLSLLLSHAHARPEGT